MAPCIALAQDRSEREIVDLIVRDGPQARAIRAEAEVARREQLARLAYPNPTVTYSREGAGFTEFLQAEQTLPIAGTRAALARAGVAATAAAEAERDVRLWQLRSNAATAVARVLAGQARSASARAHLREVERLVEVLRTREREGEGSKFDRLRAEQEIRDLTSVMTAADVELTEALGSLAGMLPRDFVMPAIAPAGTSLDAPPGTDALLARAQASRAELRALQQSMNRAAAEADSARRAGLPIPTIFGGLKRADDGANREAGGVLGVTVGVPLFDTGRLEAATWSAERTRLETERSAIEHRIRSEIAGASAVLRLRETAASQETPGAAAELLAIAEIAYREGEAGILELLDAVRAAARARERSVDLRLHVRLAQIALERAVGEVLWP
jgi:cobalt-zinc-cadmium efflux system outer membrane protein